MNLSKETQPLTATVRISSIDLVRGAIMVLMAIDHVRVYAGVPAGGPSPDIFFTRWVTNFCAPGFTFFAGTSAFLYGQKIANKRQLAIYLLSRGLLLVLLELTVIRFCWTFNFNYADFLLAGVIWMLGWCMVLLAGFVFLPPKIVGLIGLLIIIFQSYFSRIPQLLPNQARESFGRFWAFVYPSGLEGLPGISILYVLVPWIGVMAAGYGFGVILQMEPARRKKLCYWIGFSAIFLFLVIGSIIVLRKTPEPNDLPFILQLLNQRKYPASALFLLMTIGPLIAVLPFAEKAKGWLAKVLTVFGRVPLFYYLLHILIIHLSALLVNLIQYGKLNQQAYEQAPFAFVPPEYKWSLPLLYLVFLIDVLLLYFLCRWYAKYKSAHPGKKWLKYI